MPEVIRYEPPVSTGDPDQLFARLRPYNPQVGYTVKTHHRNGHTWIGGTAPRWTPVTPEQAADLREAVQDPAAGVPRPLFEICARVDILRQMEALDAARRREQGLAAGIEPSILEQPGPLPGVLSTASLPTVARRAAAIPEAAPAQVAPVQTPPVQAAPVQAAPPAPPAPVVALPPPPLDRIEA